MNKKLIYQLIDNKLKNFYCDIRLLSNLYNTTEFNILLNALKINKSIQHISFEFMQTGYINAIDNDFINELINPILNIFKNKQIKIITICSNDIYLYYKIGTLLINNPNIKLNIIYFKNKHIDSNIINNFKNKYKNNIINYIEWKEK